MAAFTITTVLPLILSISAALGLEINNSLDHDVISLNRSSVYGCTRPGTISCHNNCRDRVTCVSQGGQLVEQHFDTCQFGTICISGNCVTPPNNPLCDPFSDITFNCKSTGVFPDPGDCKSYHVCVPTDFLGNLNHYKVQCEGPEDEFAFNPKTGLCDKKLANRLCETFPIPLCKGGGGDALAANPTYYYNCEFDNTNNWFYPQQFRCDNDKKYSTSRGCQ